MMDLKNYTVPALALIMLGACSSEPNPPGIQEEFPSPKPKKRLSLPLACRHLLSNTSEMEWDPVTETYNVDDAWRVCMGVGMLRKDI